MKDPTSFGLWEVADALVRTKATAEHASYTAEAKFLDRAHERVTRMHLPRKRIDTHHIVSEPSDHLGK
jgi:hypothetical protein